MSRLSEKVPSYLYGRQQLTLTVVFTVMFVLVFMLAGLPFSDNAWLALDFGYAVTATSLLVLLSLAIVIISKVFMNSYATGRGLSVAAFVLWNISEIVAVSLFYSAVSFVAGRTGLIDLGGAGAPTVFFGALLFNSIAIGFPYVVCAMYIMLVEKDNTIRLMNYDKVVSDDLPKHHEEKRITLFDNNGTLKLSVDSDNLYFIESDDNYIKVWYMDNGGTMRQYMLRCRMKTVEESFAGSDLLRCHRKYIVNIRKVKILKSESDGYRVDLGIEGVDFLPISKTYEKAVIARFNSI